jgi:predicted ATPase
MSITDDLSSVTDTYAATYYEEGEGKYLLLGGSLPSSPTGAQTRIYGRTKETIMLQNAYAKLREHKHAQTIVVHGESGSGKTVLVDTLRDHVFDTNGYFVAGKYFQKHAAVEEPYSAVMAAFSDLCDLIIQADDFDKELKGREIADKLGTDAQILVKSISNLSPIVGDLKEIEIEASFAKFKVACKKFLHAIASEEHPVVIFLDDIQWADAGSSQLTQTFLQDKDLKHVIFVLAYRDEELEQVTKTDVLASVREPTDIALSNLDAAGVHAIVVAVMGSDTEPIKGLSRLVFKRTNGNPLHATMFMQAIQQEELLIYEVNEDEWLFNVDEIQQAMMVSESLADLLTRKIARLSDDMRETLRVASLLGYSFDESIVLEVASIMIEEKRVAAGGSHLKSDDASSHDSLVLDSLFVAVKEGFIEKTSVAYQFTHDKLQSSFLSMIDRSEEERLHFLVGEAYLENGDDGINIYRAAVHLNCAPGFLHNRQQRERLARINLKASIYCTKISAFGKATAVLQSGFDVLGPVEPWSEEYSSLTFEIVEALARAQLLFGDFEACKETVFNALCHAKTADMKATFLLIDVEVRMAGNEVDDAIATANRALHALGIKMPRKAKRRHVLGKLMKVKFLLGNKSDQAVLNLPFTDDHAVEKAVRLLMHLCTYCFLRDEADTAIFAALLAAELTLKKGLSHFSSCAFAIYGLAEVFIGNIDRGVRFGKLSLVMLDNMACKEAECPTAAYVLTMLAFRRKRFAELVTPLHAAANSGFQNGDIVYGSYSLAQCYNMHIHMGTNLQALENAMRFDYGQVSDVGQDDQLMWLRPGFQFVLNMQANVDRWEDISVLTGEMMDEDVYLLQATEKNQLVQIIVLALWKAKLAIEFNQFSSASSILESCKSSGAEAIRFSFGAAPYYFDQARMNYGLFESLGQRKHLRVARKYKRLLQRMEDDRCPSASPPLAFLIALEASLSSKHASESEVRAAYESGIAALVESKNSNWEAPLNARAGFDFTKRGNFVQAEVYFKRALDVYENDYGAIAKFNQLSRSSALAMKRRPETNAHPISGTCISIPIDGAFES